MGHVLRILGIVVGVLIALVVVAGAGIAINANRQLGARFDNPVQDVTVARTPEQIARGAYQVSAFPGCVGCHSSNPAADPPLLDGNLLKDLAPLGTFYAPNLTPGGPLKDWSDGEIIRAIREGIAKDGRGLAVMPSDEYKHLSDQDVQAIVGYLRSQPAVSKETPPVQLSPLGTVLLGTGQVKTSAQPPAGSVSAPLRGPTQEYGAYLVQLSGCTSCHGPALDGQNIPPGPPKGPSLGVVKGWSEEMFVQTIRTGVDPAGNHLSDQMPWRQFARGTDDDLRAVYAYVKSLP